MTNIYKELNKLEVAGKDAKDLEPKTTIVVKAYNLKKFTWDELLGILGVHEVHLQDCDQKKASTMFEKGLQAKTKQPKVRQKRHY